MTADETTGVSPITHPEDIEDAVADAMRAIEEAHSALDRLAASDDGYSQEVGARARDALAPAEQIVRVWHEDLTTSVGDDDDGVYDPARGDLGQAEEIVRDWTQTHAAPVSTDEGYEGEPEYWPKGLDRTLREILDILSEASEPLSDLTRDDSVIVRGYAETPNELLGHVIDFVEGWHERVIHPTHTFYRR